MTPSIRNICIVIGADVGAPHDAGYEDIGDAAGWAVSSINYCYANRIMAGTSADPFTFSPKAIITREQSIVVLNNIDSTNVLEQAGIVVVPRLATTQASGVSNWARVSSVQQFAYMDEGLAYAYAADGNLHITTPSRTLHFDMQYPLLGDVISDDDGNFYVVWGKDGTVSTEQTIFISKYSPQGTHVQTTGFVGESRQWLCVLGGNRERAVDGQKHKGIAVP